MLTLVVSVGAGAVGDGTAPVGSGAGAVGDGTSGVGAGTTTLFIVEGTHWQVAASGSNDNGTGHVILCAVRAEAILQDAYLFVKSSQ